MPMQLTLYQYATCVKMALQDDLSPALQAFSASITIEGLMLTDLWVGRSMIW